MLTALARSMHSVKSLAYELSLVCFKQKFGPSVGRLKKD